MLTAPTKRHLDAARQALVGVVPNPAAQIDLITNALVYKFMDDMDEQAVAAGGKPSFFKGELEPYSWRRLMDTRKGNQERMNLYAEAMGKFAVADKLPELFRDIFREAYLPFRSPEILGIFLTEINYFDYSHPEELGNAYEYLLSIMGAQGDAGQFRTPRHIIDFIVEAIDPTKDETVLDPACGTGGFLISAYKHILVQHDLKDGDKKPLTPADRKKLIENFEGYDISPEMVKLSRVNMYLHQFKKPKIYEYDTLSSDTRWNDKFDVIMMNPPFMSPKGGITPHKKFGVHSTRSEVLFVDYIIQHLNPHGRAGMIVPEGVIFQSGTAHKEIRKALIEDGLHAVLSLPSGVFNPYSGVKTSILFFDNEVTRRTKDLLFLKVQSDGFDLGAQRRIVEKNDLPEALRVLRAWREHVLKKYPVPESPIAIIVPREKVVASGDWNLSIDRYRVATDYTNAKWPMVELSEVCDLESGSRQKGGAVDRGIYSIGGEQISENNSIRFERMKYITETHFSGMRKGILFKGDVLMVKDGATTGKMGYWDFDYKAAVNEHVFIFRAKDRILSKYLYNVLLSDAFQSELKPYIKGIIGGISLEVQKIKIPLPPLEIQERIVTELGGYQNIITGAREVVTNWAPRIEISPEWKRMKLEEMSDRITKGTTPTTNGFEFQESGINFIKIESIDDSGYFIKEKFAHINQECNEALKRSQLKENDVLFSIAGALGRVALVDGSILPANTNQALAIISPKDELDSRYLEQVLRSDLIQNQIYGLKVGVAQSNLSLAQVSNFEIPLPSLIIQRQIVEKIEAERVLVDANRKLINLYQQKMEETITKIWEH